MIEIDKVTNELFIPEGIIAKKTVDVRDIPHMRFLSGVMVVGRVPVNPFGQKQVVFVNEEPGDITITGAEFVKPGDDPLPIRLANGVAPQTIAQGGRYELNFA